MLRIHGSRGKMDYVAGRMRNHGGNGYTAMSTLFVPLIAIAVLTWIYEGTNEINRFVYC